MKLSYTDWVNNEITKHEREIAKLMLARDVIEQANKEIYGQPAKQSAKQIEHTKPYKHNPSAVNSTKTKPHKASAHKASAHNKVSEEVKKLLLIKPMNSKQLKEELASKYQVKTVQNALYTMRVTGLIDRDDDRRYILMPKPTMHSDDVTNEHDMKLRA